MATTEILAQVNNEISQEPASTLGLKNPGFESWENGQLLHWSFVSADGAKISQDEIAVLEGDHSALIDASQARKVASSFANLIQTLDAAPFQGKKVRYRAAVRTAELQGTARAQLWFRVDRGSASAGTQQSVAFHNMDDRPIRSEDWEHYDIVLPVAEESTKLVVGIFVIGAGKAWIDDVSLEPVSADTPTHESPAASSGRASLPPVVMKAFQNADAAPTQAFFTPWLWIALAAITLSLIAMLGPLPANRSLPEPQAETPHQGILGRFAIRFSAVYWSLYCIPGLLQNLPWLGWQVNLWTERANSAVAHGMASKFFGIHGELVPPNGSGDTTYNYLVVLAYFSISILVASVWTAVDRRPTASTNLRDLLRSLLRYSIALAMIGYGLAKVSFVGNQFPPISTYQLDKTWGDSSPMNVLWAFMGASQGYTIFAGLGEVAAGLLIVWRRTCLLGALIALGVMIHVMVLNFCYDVPVKLYSTHLVVMAMMVMLPDARRLSNFFLWNHVVEPASLGGVWQNQFAWWSRWVIKSIVVGVFVLLPVGYRVANLPGQWKSYQETALKPQEVDYRLVNRGFRWINEVPYNR